MTHFRKRQSRRKTKTLINLQEGGIKWGMGFEKEVLFKRAGVV